MIPPCRILGSHHTSLRTRQLYLPIKVPSTDITEAAMPVRTSKQAGSQCLTVLYSYHRQIRKKHIHAPCLVSQQTLRGSLSNPAFSLCDQVIYAPEHKVGKKREAGESEGQVRFTALGVPGLLVGFWSYCSTRWQ